KDNVAYCKELMKIVDELRHLDGVKGGIAVSETEYMATTILEEAQPLTQVIYSNYKEVVEQGQYVFDMLWNKAIIPAKTRIKETEEGAKREFIEIIQEPTEIQKLAFNLIKSSNEEILLLFSTVNSFYLQEHDGILQLLEEAAQRGVEIRILVNKVDLIKEIEQKLKKQHRQLIDIQYFSKTLTKITT
ncbi:MAG: phospholipase D family protein, partial [Thermoproteota archaeon]|nr:phospholipase D family protein [Thermoproteota archaeon]